MGSVAVVRLVIRFRLQFPHHPRDSRKDSSQLGAPLITLQLTSDFPDGGLGLGAWFDGDQRRTATDVSLAAPVSSHLLCSLSNSSFGTFAIFSARRWPLLNSWAVP